MDDKKAIITICMGSSCFSRGNRRMIQIIQDFLKSRQLEENVTLKGAHCIGACEQGPVMKLNDSAIYKVTAENLEDILDNFFKSNLS